MSKFVTLHGFGGSGSELSFEVVGGTTQPENPKENTIWVNTDTEISEYSFNATEPKEPTEGMVWILTITSSVISFNVIKQNNITIYPVSAKQYINGTWVAMDVKIYQNNIWADFATYLYNAGDECTDLTGGWIVISKRNSSGNSGQSKAPSLTRGSDTLTMTGVTDSGGMIYTQNKIAISSRKRLTLDANVITSTTDSNQMALRILSDIGTYHNSNEVARIIFTNANAKDGLFDLDVSGLNGEYYVAFTFHGSNSKQIIMRSLKLI